MKTAIQNLVLFRSSGLLFVFLNVCALNNICHGSSEGSEPLEATTLPSFRTMTEPKNQNSSLDNSQLSVTLIETLTKSTKSLSSARKAKSVVSSNGSSNFYLYSDTTKQHDGTFRQAKSNEGTDVYNYNYPATMTNNVIPKPLPNKDSQANEDPPIPSYSYSQNDYQIAQSPDTSYSYSNGPVASPSPQYGYSQHDTSSDYDAPTPPTPAPQYGYPDSASPAPESQPSYGYHAPEHPASSPQQGYGYQFPPAATATQHGYPTEDTTTKPPQAGYSYSVSLPSQVGYSSDMHDSESDSGYSDPQGSYEYPSKNSGGYTTLSPVNPSYIYPYLLLPQTMYHVPSAPQSLYEAPPQPSYGPPPVQPSYGPPPSPQPSYSPRPPTYGSPVSPQMGYGPAPITSGYKSPPQSGYDSPAPPLSGNNLPAPPQSGNISPVPPLSGNDSPPPLKQQPPIQNLPVIVTGAGGGDHGPPEPPHGGPPPQPEPMQGSVDYVIIPLILIGLIAPILVSLYVVLGSFEGKLSPLSRRSLSSISSYAFSLKPTTDALMASVSRALDDQQCWERMACETGTFLHRHGMPDSGWIDKTVDPLIPKNYHREYRTLMFAIKNANRDCSVFKCL